MAALTADRRRSPRVQGHTTTWRSEAVLRPGVLVQMLNVSAHGVLVETPARLRPGRPAELQLSADESDEKRLVRGRIERCRVVALEPLRFEGAIVFDEELKVAEQGN